MSDKESQVEDEAFLSLKSQIFKTDSEQLTRLISLEFIRKMRNSLCLSYWIWDPGI